MTSTEIAQMTDQMLIAATSRAASVERQSTRDLLALLIEVERRKLHLTLGYSSLFVYCARALHLSEQAAYSRIAAARAARRFPVLLDKLAEGSLTLSSVGLLAPHLTDDNCDSLLSAAVGKSTREVEKLIAALHPQPDIPPSVRVTPMRTQRDNANAGQQAGATSLLSPTVDQDRGSSSGTREEAVLAQAVSALTAPARPLVAPLTSKTYLLRMTIDQETYDKLQRARALLRHAVPGGDPAAILDRALTVLLKKIESSKCAALSRKRSDDSNDAILLDSAPTAAAQSASSFSHPARSSSRHIPAAVRRAVWNRDGGRCVFRGLNGECGETGFLEFHHVIPFAAGGATDLSNLELRCRAHNAYEAGLCFGDRAASGDADATRRAPS